MWKIAVVMLTTAFFAGLLIANPYGLASVGAARPIKVPPMQVQTSPDPAQPEPTLAPVVVPQDNELVAMGEETPAPARLQPQGGIQQRTVPQKLYQANVTLRPTAPSYRLVRERHIHTAGRGNGVHYVRRRV
jgi:hypothetical protein